MNQAETLSAAFSGGLRRGFEVFVIVIAASSLIACGSGHSSASSRILVTATGRVGPLNTDRSDRADVIEFAGKPESERRGSYYRTAPFDALGYGCRGKRATDPLGFPTCQTVFYLDSHSGKLELFFTTDDRYAEGHHIHVGTPTAVAERALHERVFVGCDALLFVKTKSAFLVTQFEGGKTVRSVEVIAGKRRHDLHLVGGHVGFLVVHSQRRNPGVLDCIDG
jgi:hypothetical protein